MSTSYLACGCKVSSDGTEETCEECREGSNMTTETKHTPGPWTYFEQNVWRGDGETYGCVRGANGTVVVNGGAPGCGTEEQKANARLIAQAPTLLAQRDALLAACEKLMARSPECAAIGYPHDAETCSTCFARAAIELTKGGA